MPQARACPGGLNGDGAVNGDDLLLFHPLLEAGDPAVDVDQDGEPTPADLDALAALLGTPC